VPTKEQDSTQTHSHQQYDDEEMFWWNQWGQDPWLDEGGSD
jgi:hypothetical protein